ncbi:MAG: hypothetical protein LHV69_07905 [Elusimicrobia bacterium]|nr:hypothetical protein [Candidatus Obscuribacterium magneticum]
MDTLVELLDSEGPLTGKELCDKTKSDVLPLWRRCYRSEKIIPRIIGIRYLRLDQHVQGYARLSPSIMREFLTYTVVGLKKHSPEIGQKAKSLQREIINISRKKLTLAQKIISNLVDHHQESKRIKTGACFIIAGDVVYDMAHSELRPESSTGELVAGSDLDIIVVTENLPDTLIKAVDSSLYKEKYFYMKSPNYKEEIDYIIKDISRVDEQLQFDEFKHMVASKILDEGKFLYGSRRIFDKIQRMLSKKGVPEKLSAMEKKAFRDRENAQSYLLEGTGALSEVEVLKLFYTKEETEEIF